MHAISALVLGASFADPSVLAGAFALVLAGAYVLFARHGSSRAPALRRREPAGALDAPAVDVWADDGAPKVLVVNRSGEPVHDVRAFVAFGRRRPSFVGWIRTLPPTGDEAAKLALTADGRETWIKWRNKDRNDGRDVAVECTFCDDTGQYWRRTRTGQLEPLESTNAALQVGGR